MSSELVSKGLSIVLAASVGWVAFTATSSAIAEVEGPGVDRSVMRAASEATYMQRVEVYCKSPDDADAALCADWRSAAAAERAVVESKHASWLTVLALAFNALGLVLVFFSIRQTHETLITSNRPHLQMRRFRVIRNDHLSERHTIRLEAVNWGRSKAKIVKSHVELETGSKLPSTPRFWDYAPHQFNDKFKQATTSSGGKMDPGYVRPGDSVRLDLKELTDEQVQALNAGRLWVVGFISYCDSSENWRQYHTDFARRVVGKRFEASPDDDYEAAP